MAVVSDPARKNVMTRSVISVSDRLWPSTGSRAVNTVESRSTRSVLLARWSVMT